MAATDNVKAPVARLAFANLLAPGKRVDGKTKQEVDHWNCNLLWPKSQELICVSQTGDKILLRDLILKAAKDDFGANAGDLLKAGAIRNPMLDGDGPQGVSKKTGQRYAGYEGCLFARVGSNQRPKMVTRSMEPVTSAGELYAGCYVSAVIHAYTWTHPTNGRGVSLGLSMLQVVRDGERLGGTPADQNAFFERIADEGEGAAQVSQNGDGAAGFFG